TLLNRAMPLVRYEIGDLGEVREAECPCGRKSEQLVAIEGRVADMLSFPDGTRISPYALEDAIEREPCVRYFGIAHEAPWALRIEFLPRAEDAPADAQERLEQRLRGQLPAAVSLRFVVLDDLPKTTKRRAVTREF